MKKIIIMKKIVHILLLIVSGLVILTGYGITEYRTVEKITFGMLSKPASFSLHGKLAIVFIAFLFLHLFIKFYKKK